MKKIVILLGIPGSGKGTQAKKLSDDFGYAHISTGDLLRGLESRTDIDAELHDALVTMKSGGLVPDTVVYRLTFEAIQKEIDVGKGVILDGAIRSVEQAKAFQLFFEEHGLVHDVIVFELFLSDEQGLARLLRRGEFSRAGKIVPGKDGVEEVRGDDVPETIETRIKEQGNAVVGPIAAYYQNLGLLKKVDGSKSIAEVDKEVSAILKVS